MIQNLSPAIINKLVADNCSKPFICYVQNPTWEKQERTRYYNNDAHVYNFSVTGKKFSVLCGCKESKGEIQENDSPCCKYCHRQLSYNNILLMDSESAKTLKEEFSSVNDKKQYRYYNSPSYIFEYNGTKKDDINVHPFQFNPETRKNILRTYYVKEKLNGDVGIDIVRISINYIVKDKKLQQEVKYDKWAEIVPGKKIAAYKVTKAKGTEEIDFFDAFHINTDNVICDENVFFEGAHSMIDFIHNNEEFAKRTGLAELIKNYKGNIPENSLFLLYMYLYSEYPVIELLIKMGYYGLIYGLMGKICSVYRRENIKKEVQDLSSLLNQTTKGSAALTIPSYIGQFLNAKNADFSEYATWAALNEYKPISKENFEKYVDSEIYWYLNYYNVLASLPNIIKYGYTLEQCSKYIMKQYLDDENWRISYQENGYRTMHKMTQIVHYWKDYLETAELLGIEPDKYPQDIRKAHDDIIKAYDAVKNQVVDRRLAAIAKAYEGYKTTSKYLDIVFPKSVYDFVTEGNNQHNCVGGYANSVSDGRCRIFFIRKKDDMDRSYITAECRKNGLGQLYYRNNTPVTNYTEIEYAKAICKYILSLPWEPNFAKNEQLKK